MNIERHQIENDHDVESERPGWYMRHRDSKVKNLEKRRQAAKEGGLEMEDFFADNVSSVGGLFGGVGGDDGADY